MSKINYIGRQQRNKVKRSKIVDEPKFEILMEISIRFSGYPEKVEIIRGRDRFEYLNGFFNKRALKVPERFPEMNFSVHDKSYYVLARKYTSITTDAYLERMKAKANKKKGVKKTAMISTYNLEINAESMFDNISILVNIYYNGYDDKRGNDKGKHVRDVVFVVETFREYSKSKSKSKSYSKISDMNRYIKNNLTIILIAMMKGVKLSFTNSKSSNIKVE